MVRWLLLFILTLMMPCVISCTPTTSSTAKANIDSDSKRPRVARPYETIFSPLDLPAPTDLRLANGAPGHEYWQQQADYRINVTLDAEANTIAGRETILYTNDSPDVLRYVWIHLEQNMFRQDSIANQSGSDDLWESPGMITKGIEIDRFEVDSQPAAYSVFDTMARIDLASPLAARGGTTEIEIDWTFKIPEGRGDRMGIKKVEQGVIYELAQWFPAVAVYDDYYGWNTLPFTGSGEFYTNFGSYDVHITVPTTHIVAATGILQNASDVYTPTQLERIHEAKHSTDTVMIRSIDEVGDPNSRPSGGVTTTSTWHFRANSVRTFAWASSEAFIYDGCDLDGVFLQSVYPKEANEIWQHSTQMLRAAIQGYNTMWFTYPYPEATNVYGPEFGMEYPMIIFCAANWSQPGLYGLTSHEIGHNWFPMVVNTDERRHAWMDEGFNTFINQYSTNDWVQDADEWTTFVDDNIEGLIDSSDAPIETHHDKLPRSSRGFTQYDKPAMGLVMLREEILGPDRFDEAFRTYISRWAFKSPRPADFFRTMEDVAGVDLAWFWRGWFLETSLLDQQIDEVEQVVSIDRKWCTINVTVSNEDELVMPLTLGITYTDGTYEERRWPVDIFFDSDEFTASWKSIRHAIRIEIDPDHGFPDIDRMNNLWRN